MTKKSLYFVYQVSFSCIIQQNNNNKEKNKKKDSRNFLRSNISEFPTLSLFTFLSNIFFILKSKKTNKTIENNGRVLLDLYPHVLVQASSNHYLHCILRTGMLGVYKVCG